MKECPRCAAQDCPAHSASLPRPTGKITPSNNLLLIYKDQIRGRAAVLFREECKLRVGGRRTGGHTFSLFILVFSGVRNLFCLVLYAPSSQQMVAPMSRTSDGLAYSWIFPCGNDEQLINCIFREKVLRRSRIARGIFLCYPWLIL